MFEAQRNLQKIHRKNFDFHRNLQIRQYHLCAVRTFKMRVRVLLAESSYGYCLITGLCTEVTQLEGNAPPKKDSKGTGPLEEQHA
jgi:hypothetical protein